MERKYWYYIAATIVIIIVTILIVIFSKTSTPTPQCSNIAGKWSDWGSCDSNTGEQRKDFITSNPSCNKTQIQNCDVDCVASYPDNWSNCDPETAKQKKLLNIITTPKGSGKSCESKYGPVEITRDCTVDCTGNWSLWSSCDPNTNLQIRYFIPESFSKNCPPPQIKTCDKI